MTNKFDHKALHIKPRDLVVFTALSKRNFYLRYFITKFVLDQGAVPLNPFTTFDYFLLDTVERDVVRQANNTLVSRSDELWVFGDISDGVQAEVVQYKELGRPIRYFKLVHDKDIVEITEIDATHEEY